MSYTELPDRIRKAAETRCDEECRQPCRVHMTARQLDVFKLWANGYGAVRISLILGVSEATVRGHLRRAQQKLRPYMEEAA